MKKLLTCALTEKLINDSDSEDTNQLCQPSMYMDFIRFIGLTRKKRKKERKFDIYPTEKMKHLISAQNEKQIKDSDSEDTNQLSVQYVWHGLLSIYRFNKKEKERKYYKNCYQLHNTSF